MVITMNSIQEPPRINDTTLTRDTPSGFGFGMLGCIGYSPISYASYGFNSSIRIEHSTENNHERNTGTEMGISSK